MQTDFKRGLPYYSSPIAPTEDHLFNIHNPIHLHHDPTASTAVAPATAPSSSNNNNNSTLHGDNQHIRKSVESARRSSTMSIRDQQMLAANNHPDYLRRQDIFGINKLPEQKPKSFFRLVWIALQDKVLVLLSIVAVVSLAIGLYETFGQPPDYDENGNPKPRVEWVEGVAIIAAIAIVSLVGAANDWQKERQFVKLNKKKEDRLVRVTRGGHTTEISVFDIVVGDLVQLEPGDVVPCDGILLAGYGIKCDESSLTGESDTIKKVTLEHATDRLTQSQHDKDAALSPRAKGLDSFIISGSRVLEGTGELVATAVGTSSFYGKTLMSLHVEQEETPLQEKLNTIAEGIAKLGTLAAGIMFVVLFIRFLAQLPNSPKTGSQKGEQFLNILITAITIIVVAVPEGLPLAVTLALAFATTRMIKDNNLVRVLKACETMGGATAVCSDKTGTLTQNRMTVVAGSLGLKSRFELLTDTSEDDDPDGEIIHESHGVFQHSHPKKSSPVKPTFSAPPITKAPPPEQFVADLSPEAREALTASIVVNTSAFENLSYEDELAANQPAERYIGSKTETAILSFAHNYLRIGMLDDARARYTVTRVYPFDSTKKYMATVIELPNKTGYRLLIKGASEVMVSACASILDDKTNKVQPITTENVTRLKERINEYASNSLRAIAFVYRDFEGATSWPPAEIRDEEKILDKMTFLSIVGIKDPLRHGVSKAVADCRSAGVIVRMVTGDNIVTARAIARDCGIYDSSAEVPQIVMEGPEFRKKTPQELYELVPRLRVLARSSPDDKRKLVQTLKDMGETVAVTGDGTNDAPALKLADVGFSMGISGTEVAREASEIILMDDNFSSIVKAIIWGRTVNDAVKKFLQFQLTVNITAVVLTFVSAVANSDNESVLTAVQLLWVNLIMDTFAALALATDPPHQDVLYRKPDNRKASLITPTMWKIILGEALYQLIVSFVLNFAGNSIFDAHTGKEIVQVHSLVFNTFVWMQFFKLFVARRLDNKLNMFEGILQNWYFIAIASIIGGCQVLIMFVGGAAFNIERQTPAMWGVALLCGFGSIPVGILLRCIPDELLIRLFPTRLYRWLGRVVQKLKFWRWFSKSKDADDESPTIRVQGYDDEESRVDAMPQYIWPAPLEQVRQDLLILKLKGGRWTQIKLKPRQLIEQVRKSLSPSPSPSNLSDDGSTLHSPVSPIDALDSQQPGNNHSSTDNDGFLRVPGAANRTSSANTLGSGSSIATSAGGDAAGSRRSRSRGSSTSSGYSIDALAMVPSIVGGAIAGWGVGIDQSSSTSLQRTNSATPLMPPHEEQGPNAR